MLSRTKKTVCDWRWVTAVRTWISSQISQLQGNWNTGRLCVLRCRDCCSCQCSHGKLTADPDYPPPPPPGRWWSEQHGSGSDLLHLEANVPERSQSGTRVLRIMTMQCSLITIVGHHLRAHIALFLTSLALVIMPMTGILIPCVNVKSFSTPTQSKIVRHFERSCLKFGKRIFTLCHDQKRRLLNKSPGDAQK